jgi:hypothetical protein
MLILQPKFGEPVLPNLNVRHLCPNCRIDPPNIVEEYSKGDLVRHLLTETALILTVRYVVIVGLSLVTGS